MTTEIEIVARCAPWSDGKRGDHHVLVDVGPAPRVRVWDPVGRIFTVCHRLGARAEQRIVARARDAAARARR